MTAIESWELFNVFSVARLVQGHILATVVYYSLERYGLVEKLGLPEDKLLNFVAVRHVHIFGCNWISSFSVLGTSWICWCRKLKGDTDPTHTTMQCMQQMSHNPQCA